MPPVLLFLLAIVSPFVLATTLLVPIYIGIAGACYIIYFKKGFSDHPLNDQLLDVFYMIDVYSKLFSEWLKSMEKLSIWTYSLPLIVLPVAFTVLAIWLTAKIGRKLKGSY